MIDLPTLGMGCAGIGNLYRPIDDAVAHDTVAAAIEAGIGYFDVAPHYGFGLAELRLGAALAEHDPTQRALISTKVGRLLDPIDSDDTERHGFVAARPFEPHFDYSAEAVLRSHDESIARLRRDRIDVLLAHDLGEATHGANADAHLRAFLNGGYGAMRRLRDEGAVSAIGIGVNEIAVCVTLLDEVELDLILLAGRFTLLEQDSASLLLDRCTAIGTRLVIGGPFNSGILIDGSTRAGQSHFDYAPPPPDIVAKVVALEQACAAFGVALPAAALQFPLRSPQVASVIPGLVGRDQVEAAVSFLHQPIPPAFWEASRTATRETA